MPCSATAPAGFIVHYTFDENLINYGSLGSAANLVLQGGAVFSDTKPLAGSSLVLPSPLSFGQIGSQGAPLGSAWTAAVWFKNLASPSPLRTLLSGLVAHKPVVVQSDGLAGAVNQLYGFESSAFDIDSISNDGKWHHIAVVGHDGVEDLYVDGIFVGVVPFESRFDVFAIGNSQSGDERFADELDEFYLYGRALTDIEIQSLYNEGRELAKYPYQIVPHGWYCLVFAVCFFLV